MSNRQDKRKSRKIEVRINNKYNAEGFALGDLLSVEPCDTFTDGDYVVLESKYNGEYNVGRIYNTTRRNAHGQPFKFYTTLYGNSRSYLYEDPEKNRRDKIIGRVVRKLTEGKQKQSARANHHPSFDWPYFGIHRGDVLTVEETKDIRPGQLILLKVEEEDSDSNYFQRACCVKDQTVRVTDDIDEPHDEPLSLVIGRVVEIHHEDCNHTKAEALRAQIRRLEADDDAITNCTQILKLEHEIQALENPPEDVEDDFEWPEVIGDEN